MKKPTIVIIAGGENSRFAPLNTKTHKGFLSLLGKPIIERAFDSLKKHGFNHIVLVLSHKDFEGRGFSQYLDTHNIDLNITTVIQEKPTGQGGALLAAKDHLAEQFILASPYYPNLGQIADQLWKKQKETNASCVFSGTYTQNTELYGILKFDQNDQSKVTAVIEKPQKGSEPSNVKIDSIYLLDPNFIDELNKTKTNEYSLEDAFTSYTAKNHVAWIINTNELQSLKYPWHLFRVLNNLIQKEKTYFSKKAQIAKTAIFDDSNGPIIVDDNAIIGDFVKLVGPCYVGKNTLIGDYSFVRGSSIEERAVVGANTEVVRSIMLEDSSIHYGYLADSILGHETKVGAGLITANKRLDKIYVKVKVKEKLIDTQTNTLGIITGEKVSIGIRVNTMPGITIGTNAKIYPSVTVTRNVAANKELKK